MDNILFENEIALVLIVKNESRYIKEWLEYHYRIGVDKFYIYNNDSGDRSKLLRILDPWIQAGVVDFEDVPGKFKQMPVYNDAIVQHRFDCRYMGFVDADEFIYIKTGQTLPEFLNEHFSHDDHIAGIGINWRIFGSSGKQNYEPIDVIERFTRRASDSYKDHRVIKTILNPRRTLHFTISHSAEYLLSSICDNERHGSTLVCYSYDNSTTKIQINHYYTKSVEEFAAKHARGRSDCGDGRENDAAFKSELNEVEDFGLRDLWRELKTQPLPNPKDHSQQKILDNVKNMISNFSDQTSVEKILVCFDLIYRSMLIRETEKIGLENFLLDKLKTSLVKLEIEPWNWALLFLMTPKLLSIHSKESLEILQIIRNVIPRLIVVAETENRYDLRLCIKQMESVMDSMEGLFNG